MRRRIVITGMGVITPLGHTVEDLFRAQVAGESGVGPITRFDASTFPTTFASEVRGFDLTRYVSRPELWTHACDASKFAGAAARVALEEAGLLTGADRTRFGVYMGTGEATQEVQLLLAMIARSYDAETRTLDPREMGRLGL